MSQVIKSFLGVFLILFLCASCIGIFSVFLQVIQAQDFEAEIVREMEDSDFYPDVVKECFESAAKQGYELQLVFYGQGSSSYTVTDLTELPDDLSAVDSAKVSLQFKLKAPMFFIEESRMLEATAG